LDSKTEEMINKMLDASEEQRIEMARKRTENLIELPDDQLVNQIKNSIIAFNKLNDKDLNTALRASLIALNELPPEKKSKFISARAKAGLLVSKELNTRVLEVAVEITKSLSKESYQSFKQNYIKASEEYNIPIPEFLA
jgi:hypothetical protein